MNLIFFLEYFSLLLSDSFSLWQFAAWWKTTVVGMLQSVQDRAVVKWCKMPLTMSSHWVVWSYFLPTVGRQAHLKKGVLFLPLESSPTWPSSPEDLEHRIHVAAQSHRLPPWRKDRNEICRWGQDVGNQLLSRCHTILTPRQSKLNLGVFGCFGWPMKSWPNDGYGIEVVCSAADLLSWLVGKHFTG